MAISIARTLSRHCVVLLILWLSPHLQGQLQAAEPALDPNLPYQAKRSDPVTYDVDFAAVVTAPYHTKRLRVWLPLPPLDAGQDVTELGLTTFPVEVKPTIAAEPVFGNRFAYFEFDRPQGGQIIRHRFQIKVWQLHWEVVPGKVRHVQAWPAGFERYLKSDRAVTVDERFHAVVTSVVRQRQGPADDLAAMMGWVNDHMSYDHGTASLQASSEHALVKRTGHCSDYHGLCAAFGRALGVPTRVTYGINPVPKNSPSHCKLEAFLPPYGWVSFDLSETQRLVAAIKAAPELDATAKERLTRAAVFRLQRGFRDNTWFLQTKGTDYDLAPPASRKVMVVRTLHVEADGEPLPDPDPADPRRREYGWMTVHRYTPDRLVRSPFQGWSSLKSTTE